MPDPETSLVADIGGGYGTPATMAALRRGQFAKRLALLRLVRRELAPPDPATGFDAGMAYAKGLEPRGLADLMLFPTVGPWLTRSLRHARLGGPDHADLGYLDRLTAAHQIRAGREGSRHLRVRAGVVMLPGLGAVRFTAGGDGVCEMSVAADGALRFSYAGETVDLASTDHPETPSWRPLHRLRSTQGDGFEVVLDDLDPQRDLSDPYSTAQLAAPPPRLTDDDRAVWQDHFDQAWGILLRDFPGYAAPMRQDLRMIVPLTARPLAVGASYTSFDAFGCVHMSATGGPRQFALTLIHEFQHAKLAALTDQVELHRPDATRDLYAPWRDDPRPLAGLLQGIYAHIGVTRFWSGRPGRPAEVEFARWRRQVDRALAEARASVLLTEPGHAFVAAMTASTLAYRDHAVPARARELADDTGIAHRVAWCLRNRQVPAERVEVLRRRWPDRRPPGRLPEPELRDHQSVGRDLRSAAPAPPAPGRYTDALADHLAELRTGPGGPGLWTGLAVTLSHLVTGPARDLLLDRAELVAAVYEAVRPDDLIELLTWLAGTAVDD